MTNFGLFYALLTPRTRNSMPTRTANTSHALFPRF